MSPLTSFVSGCVCSVLMASYLLIACHEERHRQVFYLQGGDPSIDFIDFFNEDSCMFIAPGPFKIRDVYTKTDSTITIHIIDGISSTLQRKGTDTLIGRPPFFDGIWIRTNPF